jgi:Rho GTPase-activating protein 18/28/40
MLCSRATLTINQLLDRDLPEPLLTTSLIEVFACTQQFDDASLQLLALQLLVLLLPTIHQECLQLILDFLGQVAQNCASNKMGLSNLSVVFAPTLFFVRGQKGEKMLKEVEIQVSSATTTQMLIEFHESLFKVSWHRCNCGGAWYSTSKPSSWASLSQMRTASLLQVPAEIMGQLRLLNEMTRIRKASKGQKKTLFSRAKKVDSIEEPKILWVTSSTQSPPVRATVPIRLSVSEETINLPLFDHSTAQDVLTVRSIQLKR